MALFKYLQRERPVCECGAACEGDRAGKRVCEATCAQWRECEGRPDVPCVRVLCIGLFPLAAEVFGDGGIPNRFITKHDCQIRK